LCPCTSTLRSYARAPSHWHDLSPLFYWCNLRTKRLVLQMTSDVLETKTPEAARWSALPERGTLPSLRLLAWIATRIGRWAGRLLLYPITSYFVITAHAARRTSSQYLKQIRGYPAHWWNVFRIFHCFGAIILDCLYLFSCD